MLLHQYAVDGVDCVQHLDGMFAFAVWDTVKELGYTAESGEERTSVVLVLHDISRLKALERVRTEFVITVAGTVATAATRRSSPNSSLNRKKRRLPTPI